MAVCLLKYSEIQQYVILFEFFFVLTLYNAKMLCYYIKELNLQKER